MLNPIFSRHHREPGAWDIPRTPTNEERMRAYRSVAPVELANSVFNYGGGGSPCRRAYSQQPNHLPASTPSPLKDEQPRRAASPIPGNYTNTPGA